MIRHYRRPESFARRLIDRASMTRPLPASMDPQVETTSSYVVSRVTHERRLRPHVETGSVRSPAGSWRPIIAGDERARQERYRRAAAPWGVTAPRRYGPAAAGGLGRRCDQD